MVAAPRGLALRLEPRLSLDAFCDLYLGGVNCKHEGNIVLPSMYPCLRTCLRTCLRKKTARGAQSAAATGFQHAAMRHAAVLNA